MNIIITHVRITAHGNVLCALQSKHFLNSFLTLDPGTNGWADPGTNGWADPGTNCRADKKRINDMVSTKEEILENRKLEQRELWDNRVRVIEVTPGPGPNANSSTYHPITSRPANLNPNHTKKTC